MFSRIWIKYENPDQRQNIKTKKHFWSFIWCNKKDNKHSKGQLISKCSFGVFISTKKQQNFCKNFFSCLWMLNQKRKALYFFWLFEKYLILEHFWFDLFLGQKSLQFFFILVNMKAPKGHFEINWPSGIHTYTTLLTILFIESDITTF